MLREQLHASISGSQMNKLRYLKLTPKDWVISLCNPITRIIIGEKIFYFSSKTIDNTDNIHNLKKLEFIYIVASEFSEDEYWIHWAGDGVNNILLPTYTRKDENINKKINKCNLVFKLTPLVISMLFLYYFFPFETLLLCSVSLFSLLLMYFTARPLYVENDKSNFRILEKWVNSENKSFENFELINELNKKADNSCELFSNIHNYDMVSGTIHSLQQAKLTNSMGGINDDHINHIFYCNDELCTFSWWGTKAQRMTCPTEWDMLPPFLFDGDEVTLFHSATFDQLMRENAKIFKREDNSIYPLFIYNKTTKKLLGSENRVVRKEDINSCQYKYPNDYVSFIP